MNHFAPGRTNRCTRRRPHIGFSEFSVSPAADAGELVSFGIILQWRTIMARSSQSDEDEDENEEDEKPAKRKKKREGDDDGKQTKKGNENTRGLMYMLVSIPVALVLVCCCCAPIGVYFFGKQPQFAGKWEKKDAKGNVVFDLRLDGSHDGLYNDYPEGERVSTNDAIRWGGMNLRWQAIDDNTIELTIKEKNLKFWFGSDKGTFTWAVAGDELILTNTADKNVTKLSRVK